MENSIEEKLKLIAKIQEVDQDGYLGKPTGLLVHGILNTIDIFNLIRLYIGTGFQNNLIRSNIFKRLPEEDEIKEIYDYIFDLLKQSNYRDRIRLRPILEILISELSETSQLEYFTYFYNSKYVYEFNAALRITNLIWNDFIQDILIERFKETQNLKILSLLLDRLQGEPMFEIIRSTWSLDTPNWLKAKFVRKFKGAALEHILFLKDIDPNNFLVLLRHSGNNFSNEMLIDIYEKVSDKYKPFAIWNLGKLGKWEIIKNYMEDYLSNPNKVFKDFSDTIFE